MDELDEVARREVRPGWHVYDVDGELMGTVESVGDVAFTVAPTPPAAGALSIAFDDIESADQGRVDLALTAEEVQALAEQWT